MANAKLTKSEKALINALAEAILCVQWCRRAHKHDDQEGIPSEAVWLNVIAEVTGRGEASTEDFLKNCMVAVQGKIDRKFIAEAIATS